MRAANQQLLVDILADLPTHPQRQISDLPLCEVTELEIDLTVSDKDYYYAEQSI